MFWTVWANEKQNQYSGLIERSEMDGSHRLVIVSDKINAPSAISVDRILKQIFWTDSKLNTLECADIHGLQRLVLFYKCEFKFLMTISTILATKFILIFLPLSVNHNF